MLVFLNKYPPPLQKNKGQNSFSLALTKIMKVLNSGNSSGNRCSREGVGRKKIEIYFHWTTVANNQHRKQLSHTEPDILFSKKGRFYKRVKLTAMKNLLPWANSAISRVYSKTFLLFLIQVPPPHLQITLKFFRQNSPLIFINWGEGCQYQNRGSSFLRPPISFL